MVRPSARAACPLLVILALGPTCHERAPIGDAALGVTRRAFDLGVTPTFATPGPASSIAAGDLDGDGKPDLVAAIPSVGVVMFRGKGDGSFGEARVLLRGERPAEVIITDLDGDHIPDLAAVTPDGPVAFFGKGDGTFPLVAGVGHGAGPSAIVAGDFDGDGNIDLAVTDADGADVHVIPTMGHTYFRAGVRYPALLGATGIHAGDFDGDGKLDLLVTGPGGHVTLHGGPGGAFRAAAIQGGGPIVAVGDLDGDGKTDVVEASAAFEGAQIWAGLHDGDDGFRKTWRTGLPYGTEPCAIAVADLDGDRALDLLVGVSQGAAVLSLLGHGDGTFRGGEYFGVRGAPCALATADLDGDGKLDVIAASRGAEGLSVLLGRGDGTFRGERVSVVGRSVKSLAVGDVDGDGVPDAVVSERVDDDDHYTVYLGDVAGRFRRVSSGGVARGHVRARLALVDLNGDGELDLLRFAGPEVWLGHGDGAFQPVLQGAPSRNVVSIGDFDGDGFPDLLARDAGGAASVLLGKGDGTFRPGSAIDLGGGFASAAAADLDGDGTLDLAVTTGAGVRVLFGAGDGTFGPPQPVEAGARPTEIAVADYDRDGRPDLAVAQAEGSDLRVILGRGARTFAPSAPVAAAAGMTGLLARDVDGDGVPDLVAQSTDPAAPRRTVFLLGNGDGTFQAPRRFDLGGDDLALADMDRDGLPDLLVLQRGRFLRFVRNTSR